MILEIAEIRIQPGQQRAFDAAITHGLDSVLSKSPGYSAHQVHVLWVPAPGRPGATHSTLGYASLRASLAFAAQPASGVEAGVVSGR